MAMLWTARSFCATGVAPRDEQSYVLLDTATADTLVLDDESFFRPLGMQHFYDSFALDSHTRARRDALELFGLHDDRTKLIPGSWSA